jgi:glutamate formiminotransferase
MKPIVECVPNFSEGRDKAVIDRIAACFADRSGVRLLDVRADADHNRSVMSVVGDPEAVGRAMVAAAGAAIAAIDMRVHRGQHPRMGAVDVVPFIPVADMTMGEAVKLSRQVGRELAEAHDLPVFLYAAAAGHAHRVQLADIRKGQFEGMAAKIAQPAWAPDFGPARVHPTAGVTAVGARPPLIAFNVNLATDRMDVAEAIARQVRHSGGGLRYCQAMAVALTDRGMVQVSMNLTDFTRTAMYRAFELVRIEARRYGVAVAGSQVVGLVPMAALVDTAAYSLGMEDFSLNQVLEARLLEGL